MQLIAMAGLFLAGGFWLRFYAPVSPYLRDAAGGVSYVLVFILASGALFQNSSSRTISITVLSVTCTLECLQLWHSAWLEACRRTLPGRLLLGTTFEWSDFPPYFAGALLGWAILRALRKT